MPDLTESVFAALAGALRVILLGGEREVRFCNQIVTFSARWVYKGRESRYNAIC